MDSKRVSAELNREVRPLLTKRGFQKFTSRHAWRLQDDRVDVINFQSFVALFAYLGQTPPSGAGASWHEIDSWAV